MGEHAAHVGVHRGEVVVVGEDQHGARRVRADAGQARGAPSRSARQRRRGRRPAVADDRRGAVAQAAGAVVVAEALPEAQHVVERRRGEVLEARVGGEERLVLGDHARHLRLLQHDLADEDGVRVGGAAPGQVAAVGRRTS